MSSRPLIGIPYLETELYFSRVSLKNVFPLVLVVSLFLFDGKPIFGGKNGVFSRRVRKRENFLSPVLPQIHIQSLVFRKTLPFRRKVLVLYSTPHPCHSSTYSSELLARSLSRINLANGERERKEDPVWFSTI